MAQYSSVMIRMLATWNQPRKPDGELAQPRRFQLPIVEGAVGRRGLRVLGRTPPENEVMVALVIGHGCGYHAGRAHVVEDHAAGGGG